MAEVENLNSVDELRKQLEGFDEASLLGQQLVQRGGIHVLQFLIEHGITQEMVMEMLASLVANMDLVVEIAKRKGFKKLFDDVSIPGLH